MAEPSGQGSRPLAGLFQSLLAAGLGAGVTGYWSVHYHAQAPDAVKSVTQSLAGALVGMGTLYGSRALQRWATRARRRTPVAKGDRLAIYVASLGDDAQSRSTQDAVVQSIYRELTPEHVEVLRAGEQFELTEGVSEDLAAEKAHARAQKLLKEKGGDLLIWGKVYPSNERLEVDLHFTNREDAAEGGAKKVFGVGERLTLDAKFGPEVGTAVAAMVSVVAAPALGNAGRYLADILEPIAGRLERMVENLPESMRPDDRGRLLAAYGSVARILGEQSGSNALLEKAVSVCQQALLGFDRERVPLEWAAMQNNLGHVLLTLGEREGSTERLEEAVEANREALKVYTRERLPLDWAITQNNLGAVLHTLGEREGSAERLREAVDAFRGALKEQTRERAPLDWAMTQNNLGAALQILGGRESSAERLREAVGAFQESLKEGTRERVPLNWAMAQSNLGNVLKTLGELEGNEQLLQEAVDAYQEALKEYTRERVPLSWAMAQNNLGTVLQTLGEREGSAERLREAVEAYLEALEEYTRERVPLDWAMTQNNLGEVLQILGEREGSAEQLKEAVYAFREALKEYSEERTPYYWNVVQGNLAGAEKALLEFARRAERRAAHE